MQATFNFWRIPLMQANDKITDENHKMGTNSITPWIRFLPEKLTGPQMVNKIFLLLWNPKNYYNVHNCPQTVPILSHKNRGHASPPHCLIIHFNIILPLTSRSSKCSPSLGSPHQIPVCTSPVPCRCHMLRPSHSSWFDHPNNLLKIIWYKVSHSVVFSTPSVTSSLLGPNIFLSILFPNTIILFIICNKPTK